MTLRTKFIDALMSKTQAMRASQFAAIPPRHADALFLGDSITEGGLWSEWFSELTTLNRGVGGERSDAVLRRMSTIGTADTVLLLIGTNDLSAGIRIPRIVDNVRAIVSNIQASQPDAHILVQSVMPRTRKYVDGIQALNTHYEDLAEAHKAQYLNLWPALATEEGTLNPAFTADGLHLNGDGYAAWVDALRSTPWLARRPI
jgi:lysophospholipase L1-like esterase